MKLFNLGKLSLVPPGEGRTFEVNGSRVAVFHSRAGQLYATQAECPHKKGPLAEGLLGGGTLACPLHGFKFDLASGRPVDHDCGRLSTYPTSLSEQGEILLEIHA